MKSSAQAVSLFIPCFVDQLFPRVGDAVVQILTRLGVPCQYPEDQTCCGQFALTAGDTGTARRLARHFLRVFSGEGDIICPSASCTLTVRRDYPSLAANPTASRQVRRVTSRVFELSEWLTARGPLPWRPRFEGVLALHRSCKARELGVLANAAALLDQAEGLTMTTVSPYYTCCGFGGVFQAQHPDLARAIGQAYLEAVVATGATGLISLDASCFLHLRGVAESMGLNLEFYHLAEILLSE
ncbi:MAG: (Fe-S)-binding protein [Syntrophobacterales bacterium]|jgi:L-lactate dehydrogenase complex protein LldE